MLYTVTFIAIGIVAVVLQAIILTKLYLWSKTIGELRVNDPEEGLCRITIDDATKIPSHGYVILQVHKNDSSRQ